MVSKSVGLRKEVIECTTVDRIISRKLKENTKAGGGRQWEGEVGEGRQMHHDTNCIDSWNEYCLCVLLIVRMTLSQCSYCRVFQKLRKYGED